MTTTDSFDEQAYLIRYPDVAEAVRTGLFPTGRAHFDRHGIHEGRSGAPLPKRLSMPRWWNMDGADEHMLGRFDRKINLRTINDLDNLILRNLHHITPDTDFAVGVPRSGLLVANLIALHLNIPLLTLDAFLSGKLEQSFTRRTRLNCDNASESSAMPKILIIDDSIGTGHTLKRIRAAVVAAGLETKYRVKYMAAYASQHAATDVDRFFELLEHPRVFEWNVLHHDLTNSFCVDMDGVLCEDPTADENDDGEKYLKFLS